jgi:sulfotransferase family protein
MFVFCVGMFRSCSTWQYEVASHLVAKHRGGRAIGYVPGDQFAAHDDRASTEWRVLKAHDPHELFSAALAENRALAVYSYRDLRDVAYSHMYKFAISFEEFLEQRWLEHILASDRAWRTHPRLIAQRYEELVFAPARGVADLAAHLGIVLARGEAEQVAAEYSFQANLERTREISRRFREEQVDLADRANVLSCDPNTLLHWNHMRDGKVGGWRQQASAEERAILAHHCGEWLIENGYERDTAWATNANRLRSSA